MAMRTDYRISGMAAARTVGRVGHGIQLLGKPTELIFYEWQHLAVLSPEMGKLEVHQFLAVIVGATEHDFASVEFFKAIWTNYFWHNDSICSDDSDDSMNSNDFI